MKRASIVMIRLRESRRDEPASDTRQARRSRAIDYAHELGEDRAEITHLLAQIARTTLREAARG